MLATGQIRIPYFTFFGKTDFAVGSSGILPHSRDMLKSVTFKSGYGKKVPLADLDVIKFVK